MSIAEKAQEAAAALARQRESGQSLNNTQARHEVTWWLGTDKESEHRLGAHTETEADKLSNAFDEAMNEQDFKPVNAFWLLLWREGIDRIAFYDLLYAPGGTNSFAQRTSTLVNDEDDMREAVYIWQTAGKDEWELEGLDTRFEELFMLEQNEEIKKQKFDKAVAWADAHLTVVIADSSDSGTDAQRPPSIELGTIGASEAVRDEANPSQAVMVWSDRAITTKGKKRDYRTDDAITVNLDSTGKAIAEPLKGHTRYLPARVNEVVAYIYEAPSYRGNPTKEALYKKFPQEFTKRGDLAADSQLRQFTAAEMGIHPILLEYLGNNLAHHSDAAKDVEYSKVDGQARVMRPRYAVQSRASYKDARLGQMGKRGTFGATQKQTGAKANPEQLFGLNPEDRAIGMMHCIAKRDITAADLGMKRMGTSYNSLHAAAVSVMNRELSLERWGEEARRKCSSVSTFYQQQAQEYLALAQTSHTRENSLRKLLLQNKIELPEELKAEKEVPKKLPAYTEPTINRRDKTSKDRFKNLSSLERPTATLMLESAAAKNRKRAAEYELTRPPQLAPLGETIERNRSGPIPARQDNLTGRNPERTRELMVFVD